MNFLAHLHLAEATPESRLGNLLGDFVKGLPWDDRFSIPIWQGIMEHRFIDVFTDQHPAWRASRERLQDENRRYAGIIIDVFYDFFLHKHWERFHPHQSVESFIKEVHHDLRLVRDQAPLPAAEVFDRMMRQRWLQGYGEIDGIRRTLKRVSRTSPNLALIKGLEIELEANREGLEADFLRFYPDALEEIVTIRENVIPKHKVFVTTRLATDIR